MRFHRHDKVSPEERFWAKVEKGASTDCWPWKAAKDGRGYGMFAIGKRAGRKSHMIRAHRYSLELKIGRELRPDEEACHSCDFTTCCNPDHLFVGSHTDNMADMAAKRRVSGERHSRAKVTNTRAEEMRRLRAEGVSVKELAARFGLSESHASRVSRGLRRE